MVTPTKQRPPVAVRISDDLEQYLRDKAAEGHRTLTAEIRMRLEQSRECERQAQQAA